MNKKPNPPAADQAPETGLAGITLRDLFAAFALPEAVRYRSAARAEEAVREAYRIADLMLREREKPSTLE